MFADEPELHTGSNRGWRRRAAGGRCLRTRNTLGVVCMLIQLDTCMSRLESMYPQSLSLVQAEPDAQVVGPPEHS